LTPSEVLAAMNNTQGSDHLPVVADYMIAVPEPSSLAIVAVGSLLLARRRSRVNH